MKGGGIIYQLMTGLGIGLVVFATLYSFIKIIANKINTTKIHPLIKTTFSFKTTNALAVLVFGGVWWWQNSFVPAIFATIIIVYLPSQITYMRTKRLQNHIKEQLSLAVNIFADNFTVTKNIPRSIEAVGKSVANPVGGLFRKTYTELTFGMPLSKAADLLAKRMGVPYAYVFSGLLLKAQVQGNVVAPLFWELSSKISNEQEEENFQRSQVSSTRLTNTVILFVPIPFFLALYCKFPDLASTFIVSSGGRILFSLWLISVIAYVFLDRLVVDI